MLAGPLNTAVRDLEALLPASPDAYPHNLDLAGGRVLVLRLNEREYRNASFLDDRILSSRLREPGCRAPRSSRPAAGCGNLGRSISSFTAVTSARRS